MTRGAEDRGGAEDKGEEGKGVVKGRGAESGRGIQGGERAGCVSIIWVIKGIFKFSSPSREKWIFMM